MNAPLPYALLQAHGPASAAAATPVAAEAATQRRTTPGTAGAQRLVWQSRFGTIEIEVVGQTVYVNGDAVHPASIEE